MSDPPVSAPQPPPPAARGKQVAKESEGGSDSSWPGDESSGDKAGGVEGAQTVLPEAEVEDEDDVPLVRRPRVPAAGALGGGSSPAGLATAAAPAASAASTAAAPSATARGASAASTATPRGSAVPPKQGIFTGYSLKLNPPRDGAPAGAGKRGRTDTAPAVPSKKPRTRASVSACQIGTRTSGAATMPAVDPVPEEEPAAGPNAPTTGADDTVINLTSDVEDAELRDEPKLSTYGL
ncbi:brain acid soluble protein 1-like [Brachypodium distachyon]|uniref:brain acid soluble protein 1-like n=1 Tax=Brachypodium distachyon TaxID=15368 RepID=UPI0005300AAB|nr:brain acid soluble protein 1-like [Brachypodium distachyon]|eukprot:XP_010239129.1 brain acid soluble protein 1-like [Brachypodium distachyon]